MKKGRKSLVLFSIGAVGYGIIEILWRGHTHWSMTLAGGISFMGMSEISTKLKKVSLFFKAIASSIFITAVELIFGVFFNIILKKHIWDYSNRPFNLKGQICLLYSLFWVILSLFFVPLAGKISKKLDKN